MIPTLISIVVCGVLFILYCMSFTKQHVFDTLHLNCITKNYQKKALEYSKEEIKEMLINIIDEYFTDKPNNHSSQYLIRNGYSVRFISQELKKGAIQRVMIVSLSDIYDEEIFRIRVGNTSQGSLFMFISDMNIDNKYEYMVKKTNKVPNLYGHTALYGDKDYESEEGSRFNNGIAESNFLDLTLRKIL